MENRLEGKDFIIVGQQPWDVEIGSNCKNIAIEISKYNRVLYVNSPLDRITLLKNKKDPKVQKRLEAIKTGEGIIEEIKPNLYNLYPAAFLESINWIKSHPIFNFLNKINNKRYAKAILKATKKLGFSNPILFNDNDMFRCFYLPELLNPALSIYYSRDYMLAVDYWKWHGEIIEPLLIKKSSLCVANSTYLANYCKKHNPNSHYIGQGCELELFYNIANPSAPTDVVGIPRPIIGYVGALQSLRLDLVVLKHIATFKPDWHIVLVGPEDDTFTKSDLHNIPNIHFLGPKKPDTLPQYINAFDVCINPQIVSQVTIGNYPRKIDEYLAVGKPVVATRTEAMEIFEQHTYLATDKETYVKYISDALANNSIELQQARRSFALSHSWENSVADLYSAILSTKQP